MTLLIKNRKLTIVFIVLFFHRYQKYDNYQIYDINDLHSNGVYFWKAEIADSNAELDKSKIFHIIITLLYMLSQTWLDGEGDQKKIHFAKRKL